MEKGTIQSPVTYCHRLVQKAKQGASPVLPLPTKPYGQKPAPEKKPRRQRPGISIK